MRSKRRPRRQRLRRHTRERPAQSLLDCRHEFVDAHAVEDVFEARFEPVGAIAGVDEHPHDGIGDFGGILGAYDDAGVFGEVLVPGDAADAEAKPHAGVDPEAVPHLDGGKGDVVGVLEHGDFAGAVIGDVEFARQTGQRTVVEDVIMPFTRVRPGVDQFLRIDTGGRCARDVADVVGAGAARTESEILNALDQRHRMLRRNFAKLQIGARGDVAERPAQLFGQIRQPRELPVLEDAVGDAQPAHVGILRRRDIEQSVIAPAEIVRRRRRRVGERLLFQPRIGIEGMFLALEFLRVGELLARGEDPVLRLEMRGLRPDRLGHRLRCTAGETAADPADLQAGGEALEIALLLVGEVDRDGFDFHSAQRSSSSHQVALGKGTATGDLDSADVAGSISKGPTSFVAAETHQ